MTLCFDQKLFQRGQTWNECLEAWSHERAYFLARIEEAQPLPKLTQSLQALPEGCRVVVYYNQYRTDARKFLPTLGKSLSAIPHIYCRYFDADVFFPLLNPLFGRCLPCVAMLDENGRVMSTWGPRPKTVTQELEKHEQAEQVPWLLSYDQDRFHELAETELISAFRVPTEA